MAAPVAGAAKQKLNKIIKRAVASLPDNRNGAVIMGHSAYETIVAGAITIDSGYNFSN
ncbi:MAG TPA: hypothetical protein VIY48_18850 [Candidatus Paceibacterota bacterium]